ncbi:MAG TPA: serine protease [Chitinophagaceae bacterium]|nr:serine protease [Chitinophagaceae bacterium]
MEELQMLDAVERYIRGQMNPQEKEYFEQLRKSNPEVDQLVVAHTMFINQLNKYGEQKNFKATLNEVHASLVESGEIKVKAPQAKVVDIFRRNKKVWAVAASIAGITAITIAGMISYVSQKDNNAKIELLERKFDAVNKDNKRTNDKLNEVTARISKAPQNAAVIFGGTGFLIDGKGLIVTNAHVVNNASSVIVQNHKQQEFRAKTVYTDVAADIAFLKIEDEDFKALASIPYGFKKTGAKLGEQLYTLGYPGDAIVYNEGYMSAKTGFKGDTLTCQIGVFANPGNSGGPVFNKNGEVIGIVNTRQLQAVGVVFAITSKYIFRSLEEAKKDTAFQQVKLPTSSSIKNLDRTQQIEKIEDCVFMVKSY